MAAPGGQAGLPSLLLDEGAAPGGGPPPPGAGRVWNLFSAADLEGLPEVSDPAANLLRVYDLSLLGRLEDAGRAACPVLVAHSLLLPGLALEPRAAGLYLEVSSRDDLEVAEQVACDGYVARGLDAPGPCRESTSLVLFQLLATRTTRPYWVHAYCTPALFAALRAEGAAGVILPADQLDRDDSLARWRVDLGGGSILRVPCDGTPEAVRDLARRCAEDPAVFLRETLRAGAWAPGMRDLAAEPGALAAYLALAAEDPRPACPPEAVFGPDGAYARRHRGQLGLVQGPLSRIAVDVEFARSVHEAGGFPYLALAGLGEDEVERLVRQAAAAGFGYGVGIVAVAEDLERFERLVALLEEVRPARVLLATPRLEMVTRLLETDLELWVHAPTGAMYRALRELGVRRFVVEGEEAGGHVSATASLTAWQDVLDQVVARGDAEEVEVSFAGGLASREGLGLLATLLEVKGLAGRLSASAQLGTAYLTTDEAVRYTPMGAGYRAQVLAGRATAVTGESLRLRVRQVRTRGVEALRRRERELWTGEQSLDEKRAAIEASYLGTLRRALDAGEGDDPEGASFMAGCAAALMDQPRTVAELHAQLLDVARPGAARRVEVVGPAAPGAEPIAVVGMGLRLPGARDPDELLRVLLRGRCFVRDVPEDLWEREVFLAAEPGERLRSDSGIVGHHGPLEFDPGSFRIPPSAAAQMDRAQKMALLCARDALADAGLEGRAFDRSRVGVMIANSMGGDAVDQSQQAVHLERMRARLEGLARERGHEAVLAELLDAHDAAYPGREITEDTLPGELASLIAGRVAWAFDLHGPHFTIDSACASSLAAVATAVRSLRSRETDLVLAGGVDTQVDPGLFVKFSRLTALSAHGSFPFDARADGFVIGEGCALLALKREADARRDGDRIWARILGVGSSSDGAGRGITAPQSQGQLRAMRRAWRDAGRDPEGVAYIECHGTGTPLGDATELESVDRLVGPRAAPVPVGSVKAVMGHLKAAAGAAGLAKGVLAVNARLAPAQVNHERPTPAYEWDRGRVEVPTRARALDRPPGELTVGVSSFGFGGTNFHVVLSDAPALARPPILEVERELPVDLGALDGDVALLFPGQGAQTLGMVEDLRAEPWGARIWDQADAVFEALDGRRLSELVYPEVRDAAAQRALTDTAVAQPAILVASALLLEGLRREGVGFGVAIGHSLGEYTALYAAGTLGFEDALRAVSLRGRAMREAAGGEAGAMGWVGAEGPRVAALVAEVPGYVVVANHNSPTQTVVAGDVEAVDAALEAAAAAGLRGGRLEVAAAFHSEKVASCVGDLKAALEDVPLAYGRVPVPANLSGEVYPHDPARAGRAMDPDDRARTLDLLTRQVAAPVDFVRQVEAAYGSGARRFVEVGPRRALTGLVQSLLDGRPHQALPLSRRTQGSKEALAGLQAQLAEPVRIHRSSRAAPRLSRPPRPAPARPAPSPLVEAAQPAEAPAGSLRDRVVAVVAEVSGYAPAQIGDQQDFEADLGIDTLKIFEIFSRLRGEVLPTRIKNFRDLTSVAKVVAAAGGDRQLAGAPAGGDDPPARRPGSGAPDAVQCLRYLRVPGQPIANAPSEGLARFQVLLDAALERKGALFEAARRLHSPQAREVMILMQLPERAEELCGRALPDLHETLVALAERHAAGEVDAAHLITVTGRRGAPESSVHAFVGFMKSAQKDLPGLRLAYHHVVAGAPPPEQLAALMARPGFGRQVTREGATQEGRLVPLGDLPPADAIRDVLGPDDLVLVTGGARGITGEVVRGLLARVASRFLLIGRSPEGPTWGDAAGAGRVEYLSADLTDPGQIAALELEDRGVTVVLHGAGVESSRNLRSKDAEEVRRTLAVKALGLRDLVAHVDGPALRSVISFSSVASLFGNHGQADYAAANGFLNGYGLPDRSSLAIAWTAWADVGMATRGPAPEALRAAGVGLLGLDEGVELAARLVAWHLAEPQGTRALVAVSAGVGDAFLLPDEALLSSHTPGLGELPLVLAGERVEFTYRFDLSSSRYLADHRINGRFYLPGASVLRQFLKKAAALQDLGAARFTDVRFLAPVVFTPEEERTFVVEAHGDEFVLEAVRGPVTTPAVQLGFEVREDPAEAREEARQRAAELRGLADQGPLPFEVAPAPVSAEDIYKTYFHGPGFQVLESLEAYNGRVLRGRVRAPEPDNPMADFGAAPWLLEAVFHTAGLTTLIDVDCGDYYVPQAIDEVRVLSPAAPLQGPAEVLVEVLESVGSMRFDAVVVGGDGEPVMEVRGLTMGQSREDVPHKKAILPRGAPLRLNGAEVLLVDPREVEDRGGDEWMTPAERADLETPRTAGKRGQRRGGRLAAKALCQHRVADRLGRRYELTDFEVLSGGGPPQAECVAAPHLDPLEGLEVSISHCPDLAAAALAEGPVGVDVEAVRALAPEAASRALGPRLEAEARQWVERFREDPRLAPLYEAALPLVAFTQREAVLKAAGVGLGGGAEAVTLERLALSEPVTATYGGETWRVLTVFDEAHVLSVARREAVAEARGRA